MPDGHTASLAVCAPKAHVACQTASHRDLRQHAMSYFDDVFFFPKNSLIILLISQIQLIDLETLDNPQDCPLPPF